MELPRVYRTRSERLSKDEVSTGFTGTQRTRLPSTWFGVGTKSRASHGTLKTSEQHERLLAAGSSCDPRYRGGDQYGPGTVSIRAGIKPDTDGGPGERSGSGARQGLQDDGLEVCPV